MKKVMKLEWTRYGESKEKCGLEAFYKCPKCQMGQLVRDINHIDTPWPETKKLECYGCKHDE